MTNVFIVHGVEGYPEENWFPWLKKELESLGCNVFVPQFPTPENQILNNWLAVLNEYKDYLNNESIVVGHSLGVPFLLNVLEVNSVKAAFLVAGFTGKAGNEFDESMKTFAQREFNWGKIRRNCKHFKVFHSDNDPYVSLDHGKKIAENLGVELTLIKEAGHFNKEAGYTEFPLLMNRIKELI